MIGWKTRATYSTNQTQNQNQSRPARTRALGAGYVYLFRVFIGSFSCLRLLWLAIVIAVVLVLRHSNENRSVEKNYTKSTLVGNVYTQNNQKLNTYKEIMI